MQLIETNYQNKQKQEQTIALVMLLIISSIVIADPKSQLDLSDDFNNLNIDEIFNRGEDFREPEKEENEWRKPKQKPKREVRWGAKNIYDEDKELDPFSINSVKKIPGTESPEITPQFQIRFRR